MHDRRLHGASDGDSLRVRDGAVELLQDAAVFHIDIAGFLQVEDHAQLPLCEALLEQLAQQTLVLPKTPQTFISSSEELAGFQLTKIYPIFELVLKNLRRPSIGVAQLQKAAKQAQTTLGTVFVHENSTPQSRSAPQRGKQQQQQDHRQRDGENHIQRPRAVQQKEKVLHIGTILNSE